MPADVGRVKDHAEAVVFELCTVTEFADVLARTSCPRVDEAAPMVSVGDTHVRFVEAPNEPELLN